MSTDKNLTVGENSTEDSSDQRLGRSHSTTYQTKLAVHMRDEFTCINCRETFDDDSHLDADHVLARGKGGANTIRNQVSLCRRCHEAKHDERDHAPTIRAMSTGDMSEKDFRLFRQFWGEQLPALFELALDHRVRPIFDLSDNSPYNAWHVPVGDLRRLDEVLAGMDEVKYAPLGAENYM